MDILVPVGRALFAMLFIGSGVSHLTQHGDMTQYARQKGVPAPGIMVLVSGVMLLVGGFSVLLGYRVDIGGLILFAFLVPTALMMHSFWKEADPMQKAVEMAHFMKNLALAGGALLLAYFGGGPYSVG
ncbi:MAG TPA: DoxX family protein [Longimicrobiales bacterium]|nr:DoxX family protein [Longimicrobiales bacterium]